MKILLGSLLAFCAGAVLGWDWSEESKVDVEKAVVLSDRILVNKEVEVVDPAWVSWAGRISLAESGRDLQGLLAELEASGMKGNAGLKKLICRRWVELDPEAGVTALGSEVKFRATFYAEWLAKDFEGAMASMKGDAARMSKLVLGELLAGENFEVTLDYLRRTGSFETDRGVKANEEWLRLLRARTGEMEELVLKVLEREGRGVRSATGQLLKKLGRVKFEAEPNLALEWAESFQEEGRRYVLEGLMTAWVKDDPFAVAAKFDEWREEESRTFVKVYTMNTLGNRLANSLIEADYSAGLAWLDRSGSFGGARAGGRLLGVKMQAGELSAEAVYDEIAKMKNPHEMVRREVLREMWESMRPKEVSELVKMLQGKEEGRTKALAMSSLLKQVMADAPEETARGFSEIPAGKSRDEVVSGILRNHARTAVAADFIKGLPLEVRGVALAAFYEKPPEADKVWGYQKVVYPGEMAEELGALPDDGNRTEAMKGVGFHWGAIDPKEALKWVGQLSGGDQVTAMTGVARGWSQQNPRRVTDYVEELESGGIRDGAIAGLVAGVGEHDPESAWLWSEMIDGEEMRKEARAAAVTWWAEVDAEAAREALENVDLSNTEAEELRAILK